MSGLSELIDHTALGLQGVIHLKRLLQLHTVGQLLRDALLALAKRLELAGKILHAW